MNHCDLYVIASAAVPSSEVLPSAEAQVASGMGWTPESPGPATTLRGSALGRQPAQPLLPSVGRARGQSQTAAGRLGRGQERPSLLPPGGEETEIQGGVSCSLGSALCPLPGAPRTGVTSFL